jgi:hypothetical protein
MKPRINSPVAALAMMVFVLVLLVCPQTTSESTAAARPPDMPLNELIPAASADINGFWKQSFVAGRLRYTTPTMMYYVQPIRTACGNATLNNAFYCSASNSIYYDYNFMRRMYSGVGDYAAVSILAHEWGHLVQTQLGISRGNAFTIQMELQADCFAGAYSKYAERTGKLDPGDLEEAGAGLFNAGDPEGMPWFSPMAHGKSMQRINAFLDGYRGGAQRCLQ